MVEKIGNVVLDDTHYSGTDLYSDGEIEDTLLSIAKEHTPDEFRRITEEQANWPVFYHMSPLRTNIVEWLPMDKSMKVLEVGAGAGAITGVLSKKAGTVTCVELSKKRSMINAYRNREQNNITIRLGNFEDVEPDLPNDYDYIILIGVFEYGHYYIHGQSPYEDFLRILYRHLKAEGRLVIAIENRLGMKYFAGAREDHNGLYFSGLEGYIGVDGANTFSKQALERMFHRVGIDEYRFYYPYPDYKFMHTVYSDEVLPKKGELFRNIRNFDRERLFLFNEQQAFDAAIEDGTFPVFSNSFLVIIGAGVETDYARYSNDRDDCYGIVTTIGTDKTGQKYVTKRPLTKAADAHVEQMTAAYEKLKERYEAVSLIPIRPECLKDKPSGGVRFAYINGKTLEEKLDELITKQDISGAVSLVKEFYKRISANDEVIISNLDFNFDNIIIPSDGEKLWYLIDYEWTAEEKADAAAIMRRTLYCYCNGRDYRETLVEALRDKEFPPSLLPDSSTAQDELAFQRKIEGKHLSTVMIRDRIGNAVVPVGMLTEGYTEKREKTALQIYWSMGDGFSEQNSSLPDYNRIPEKNKKNHGKTDCEAVNLNVGVLGQSSEVLFEGDCREVIFTLPGGSSDIRIDPARCCCLVRIDEISIDGKLLPLPGGTPWHRYFGKIKHNGRKLADGLYLFTSEDPHFQWGLNAREFDAKLVIRLHVMPLSARIASVL